jgi:MFS family permease
LSRYENTISMNLQPSESLSVKEINRGLNLVIKDGLAAEAMSVFTGGTFLVAMAVMLGASNLQIGLLAALPTLTNIFQLIAIWLVQQYNNRRAVAVFSNVFARFPLLVIGCLPLLFTSGTSIRVLIFLLFFHYFFGSIAGAGWNSWMKDLVPEEKLGSYFSHRTRLTQTLNVVLSLLLALTLDHIKKYYPHQELMAYSIMFICGGVLGILGTYILSRTPEPKSYLPKENLLKLFKKPLRDKNFRRLLFFNSFWSFALNLATPFFTVYMMNSIHLSLSYIIGFGILNQVAGIFAVKVWGSYSDQFSNKTIIQIAAPAYILCILAWSFVGLPVQFWENILLIGLINILSGVSLSGTNLAVTNIGMKLSPKDEAIVYLSARNMIVAFVSALGPLAGGLLADYFSKRSLVWNIQWNGIKVNHVIRLIHLHDFSFLFVIGGLLALVALRTIRSVKEDGEIEKQLAVGKMRVAFRTKLKGTINRETLLSFLSSPITYPISLKKRIEQKVIVMRNKRAVSKTA